MQVFGGKSEGGGGGGGGGACWVLGQKSLWRACMSTCTLRASLSGTFLEGRMSLTSAWCLGYMLREREGGGGGGGGGGWGGGGGGERTDRPTHRQTERERDTHRGVFSACVRALVCVCVRGGGGGACIMRACALMCVCVPVCVRERERETHTHRDCVERNTGTIIKEHAHKKNPSTSFNTSS